VGTSPTLTPSTQPLHAVLWYYRKTKTILFFPFALMSAGRSVPHASRWAKADPGPLRTAIFFIRLAVKVSP
jgi:hypothetical protein